MGIPIAIIIAVSALTGCSGGVGGLVNGAVQGATGGDVSLGGALPASWPEQVPVIDGEILFGAGGTAADTKGWTVTIKSAAGDPLGDARKQLEDAGFVLDTQAQAAEGDAGVVAVKNDSYQVLVVGNADGVLYTVTPVSAG